MSTYMLTGPTAVKWGYGSSNWQTISSGSTYSFGKTSGGVNYVAMFQFTIPSGITNISQIILYAYGYPNTDGGAVVGKRTVARLSTATPNSSSSTTVNQWVNFTGYLSQSNTNAIKTPLGSSYRTYSYAFTSGLSTLTAGSKIFVYILGVDNSSYSDALRNPQYPYLDITYGTTPTTYKITYYKNDNSGTSSTPSDQSALTSGSSYTLKKLSQLGWSRSGYALKGWGTTSSATSTSAEGASKTCYGDTSWYAIWESSVSSKTITFVDGSGYNSNGSKIAYSNTAYFRFPSASNLQWARTGYTLAGWDTSSSGSTVVYGADNSYSIAYANLRSTYYAVWQANVTTKTIEFYSMVSLTSGTSPGRVTASSNDTKFTFPGASDFENTTWAKTGYTLLGWVKTSSEGGFKETATYDPGTTYEISYSNLQDSYYAVWVNATVTFTYKAGSYASNTSDYFQVNYDQSSSDVSLSTNYFVGGEKSNIATSVTLTCDCNNGRFSNGDITYERTDTNYYITKYGQTGWQLNNSVSSGTRYTAYAATANTTFYPYWGSSSSNWKWNRFFLTVVDEEPTRSGYTFKEWNSNKNGTGTSYSPGETFYQYVDSSYGDTTIYAIWTANTYTINYKPTIYCTGSAWSDTQATPNKAYTLSTSYFTGTTWNSANQVYYTNYNCNTGAFSNNATTASTSNYTYKQYRYKQTAWQTSNSLNSGSPITTYNNAGTSSITLYPYMGSSIDYGYQRDVVFTILEAPIKVGWAFKGWNTDSSGTGTMYQPGDKITQSASSASFYNTQLYAIWEPEWTVKISNGTVWSNYHVWIYTGATTNGGWQQAIPYVYNGSTWKLTSI